MDKHIVFGVFAGALSMLLTASFVINAAIGRPQECIVKYGTKNYEVVMVGRYELRKQP